MPTASFETFPGSWPPGPMCPMSTPRPEQLGNADGLRHGSLHDWAVWHGDAPIATFGQAVGRFVSEYGFQSYPDSALLARFLNPEELHRFPGLEGAAAQLQGRRPILRAIREWLGMEPRSWGVHPGLSRCRPRPMPKPSWPIVGPSPDAWALVWQLNDCWPGPS